MSNQNDMEQKRREDFKALERTWEIFRDIPDAELEQEVERAIRKMRARRRKSQPTQS